VTVKKTADASAKAYQVVVSAKADAEKSENVVPDSIAAGAASRTSPALERLASIQKSLEQRTSIQRSSAASAPRPALKPLLQKDD